MKKQLEAIIQGALAELIAGGKLTVAQPASIHIERTRSAEHGDYACNIAMVLAKEARMKPRDIATLILAQLPASDTVRKTEIAGPGFLNFFIGHQAYYDLVAQIHESGEAFGRSSIGAGRSVMVEFVSANPTGPLHVGHGRGAAYGATVADLLAAVGFRVHREYYINDAGRQMDILGTSIWLRYLELCGETVVFPSNGYKGDYIFDIAADVHRAHGDKFRHSAATVFADLPADEPQGGDKELHIDALIGRCKQLLGAEAYETVFGTGLEVILGDIRQDLQEFGVVYDHWYSERGLVNSGAVDKALARLQASGHTYEKDGALWFRSTDYGDEKDRVLVRDNGVKTYFASDIAYHADKLERGFERVIDIWGADHHGYVPRVKAAMTAMGDDAERLDVLLVQFAILYKGGERMQMSTRSGEFVTLRQLRDDVGNDAARLFYVLRRCEQHMDFDLDLAVSRSADNPVYYIQYAHARIFSVERQLAERGLSFDLQLGREHLSLLSESHEYDLMVSLSKYPEVLEAAALAHEPHQLAHFLRDLANDFHTYYNAHQFIVEDAKLRNARLTLIFAVRQVVRNGLSLLGVSAPEEM